MEDVKKRIEILEYKIGRCFPQYNIHFSRSAARHVLTGYHPITGSVMQTYLDRKLISQRTVDSLSPLFNIKDLPEDMSEYAVAVSVHMLRSHADFIEKTWRIFKWEKEYGAIPFEHKAKSFFSYFLGKGREE